MMDGQKLLAEYARTGSDATFRELLLRYTDLVYSTAVRRLNGDADLAKDVTQTVFVALARKAGKLPQDTMLGGWLHRHTMFVAATVMRSERRRRLRERQAVEMNILQEGTQANLAQITPILDEAICQLDVEARNAILLRFFEKLDFRAVGEMLNTNEEAARKRVIRALEKLQLLLKRRGVTLSGVALGTVLATEAVKAAPADLAAAPLGASALHGALTFLNMTTPMKAGIAVALVMVCATIPFIVHHQHKREVLQQNDLLEQRENQLSQVLAENVRLSNLVARAANTSGFANHELSELLRLRGEVGRLREMEKELEQLLPPPSPWANDERSKLPAQERMIYVSGEVLTPGEFVWTNGMTLSSAIELARGFAPLADQSIIQIAEPNNKTKTTINYGGELTGARGPLLDPGTAIFVGRAVTTQPAEPDSVQPDQQ